MISIRSSTRGGQFPRFMNLKTTRTFLCELTDSQCCEYLRKHHDALKYVHSKLPDGDNLSATLNGGALDDEMRDFLHAFFIRLDYMAATNIFGPTAVSVGWSHGRPGRGGQSLPRVRVAWR
jgi:hypothetical protein